MASWAEHAIWWHVYPLGFTGAEAASPTAGEAVRHRLRQLDAWLDYAVELGCAGLLLGPVFAAETHGFDGVKEQRAGGDDEIRPAFPASPAQLPADGWPVFRLHQRLIGFDPFRFPVDLAGLTVAETPDPGARPDDPALVPGHGWVILSP